MTPLFDTQAYHSCTVFSADIIYHEHYDGILEEGGIFEEKKLLIIFHINELIRIFQI